jgi:Carboxylesterase family
MALDAQRLSNPLRRRDAHLRNPYVFGNGVGLPLPSGNCSFTAQENAISESLIAAWSTMASTGNPSVQGGLQWPQWNSNTSIGVNIVNATSVGVVDYSVRVLGYD